MKLKIEIRMDKAAFEPEQGTEAGRILRELATLIKGEIPSPNRIGLFDINGNRVGEAKITN